MPPETGAPRPEISVVVPVYCEEESLPELWRRLQQVLGGLTASFEAVFVDDGSTDGSLALLRDLQRRHPDIRILKFSRNFGHHLAMTAGLDHARGEFVVVMDADLQDQPEDIPLLLARCREGFDVVFGVRRERADPWLKQLLSRLFLAVLNRTAGAEVELNSCVFRVMRRHVVERLRVMRERDRYLVGMISWLGFRQTGVAVSRPARFAGRAKYDLRRSLALGANVLTSFSLLPLRLAAYAGAALVLAGFAGCGVLAFRRLAAGIPPEGWSVVALLVGIIGGAQLLALGVLGAYVGRIYREAQARPLYVLEESSDL